MSKSLKLAAIAAAMVVGSTSVQATTTKQVRKIAKQEVTKILQEVTKALQGARGPTGPQGPAGPTGMDGFPSLFAHVFLTGIVDNMLPGGITQDNVVLVESPAGKGNVNFSYCFSGLPPVTGGQITLDGQGTAAIATPYLTFTDDPMCSPRVHIAGPGGGNTAAGFHILLY